MIFQEIEAEGRSGRSTVVKFCYDSGLINLLKTQHIWIISAGFVDPMIRQEFGKIAAIWLGYGVWFHPHFPF
jgi:hypothetical protein